MVQKYDYKLSTIIELLSEVDGIFLQNIFHIKSVANMLHFQNILLAI